MRTNNNIKRYNNIPIQNAKFCKNEKMIIGTLFTNLKRRLSPPQNGNIFVKKLINTTNRVLSSEKCFLRTKKIKENKILKENKSQENCRIKTKSKNPESSRLIQRRTIINTSRNINKKINSSIKDNSINYTNKINSSINSINKRNYMSHDKNKPTYIYQKKN